MLERLFHEPNKDPSKPITKPLLTQRPGATPKKDENPCKLQVSMLRRLEQQAALIGGIEARLSTLKTTLTHMVNEDRHHISQLWLILTVISELQAEVSAYHKESNSEQTIRPSRTHSSDVVSEA